MRIGDYNQLHAGQFLGRGRQLATIAAAHHLDIDILVSRTKHVPLVFQRGVKSHAGGSDMAFVF